MAGLGAILTAIFFLWCCWLTDQVQTLKQRCTDKDA